MDRAYETALQHSDPCIYPDPGFTPGSKQASPVHGLFEMPRRRAGIAQGRFNILVHCPTQFLDRSFLVCALPFCREFARLEDPPPKVPLRSNRLLLRGDPLTVLIMIVMDRFHESFHHPPG